MTDLLYFFLGSLFFLSCTGSLKSESHKSIDSIAIDSTQIKPDFMKERVEEIEGIGVVEFIPPPEL